MEWVMNNKGSSKQARKELAQFLAANREVFGDVEDAKPAPK